MNEIFFRITAGRDDTRQSRKSIAQAYTDASSLPIHDSERLPTRRKLAAMMSRAPADWCCSTAFRRPSIRNQCLMRHDRIADRPRSVSSHHWLQPTTSRRHIKYRQCSNNHNQGDRQPDMRPVRGQNIPQKNRHFWCECRANPAARG